MKQKSLSLLLLLFLVAACTTRKQPDYPDTKRIDHTDNYHGTIVADPYRWLEDSKSPELESWIKSQNTLTDSFLSVIPFRDKLRKRFEEIWNYEKYSTPTKLGKSENIYFIFI